MLSKRSNDFTSVEGALELLAVSIANIMSYSSSEDSSAESVTKSSSSASSEDIITVPATPSSTVSDDVVDPASCKKDVTLQDGIDHVEDGAVVWYNTKKAMMVVLSIVVVYLVALISMLIYCRANITKETFGCYHEYSLPLNKKLSHNRLKVRVTMNPNAPEGFPDCNTDTLTEVRKLYVEREKALDEKRKESYIERSANGECYTIKPQIDNKMLNHCKELYAADYVKLRPSETIDSALKRATALWEWSSKKHSADSEALHVLHLTPNLTPKEKEKQKKRKVVVHFNGIGGNMHHYMRDCQYTEWLRAGYEVFTFRPRFWDNGLNDQSSDKEPDSLMVKTDSCFFVDHVIQRLGGDLSDVDFNIYGHSYGSHLALTTTHYLHKIKHVKIAACGLETPFKDVQQAISVDSLGRRIVGLTLGLANSVVPDKAIAGNSALIHSLGQYNVPIGIFASPGDHRVGDGPDDLKQEFESAAGHPLLFKTIPDAHHSNQSAIDSHYGARLRLIAEFYA